MTQSAFEKHVRYSIHGKSGSSEACVLLAVFFVSDVLSNVETCLILERLTANSADLPPTEAASC